MTVWCHYVTCPTISTRSSSYKGLVKKPTHSEVGCLIRNTSIHENCIHIFIKKTTLGRASKLRWKSDCLLRSFERSVDQFLYNTWSSTALYSWSWYEITATGGTSSTSWSYLKLSSLSCWPQRWFKYYFNDTLYCKKCTYWMIWKTRILNKKIVHLSYLQNIWQLTRHVWKWSHKIPNNLKLELLFFQFFCDRSMVGKLNQV